MKFSLCIGAYPGKDAVYHLEKVKEHGFQGLEYYAWWELGDLKKLAAEQERIGVGLSATCTKFISLVDESLRDDYVEGVRQTIEACRILGVRSIISQTGNVLDGVPRDQQRQAMVETLKLCAPLLEEAGMVLEVEPLNGLVDHAGHFLQRSDESVDVIDQLAARTSSSCSTSTTSRLRKATSSVTQPATSTASTTTISPITRDANSRARAK